MAESKLARRAHLVGSPVLAGLGGKQVFARRSVAFRRLRFVAEAHQADMLPALVVAAGGGWVTQMQSKYGATAAHAAKIWAGNLSDTDSQVFKTIGYYWHAPEDVDSNRGLGCAAPSPTRH